MTKHQIASLQAGDLVTIEFGGHAVTAEIVEDRGPLGPKGTKLFHVEIPTEDTEPIRLQLAEDELEEHRPPPPLSLQEVKDYLLSGGLSYMLRHGDSGRPPRFWMYRNNVGRVSATTKSVSRRGEIGGAELPMRAVTRGKIVSSKLAEVLEFVRSFGLSRAEAEEVVRGVGVRP